MAKTATQEILVPDEVVMNQIYVIRGQKVMLDKDLAIFVWSRHREFKQGRKAKLKALSG